jgi:hypothetical protein
MILALRILNAILGLAAVAICLSVVVYGPANTANSSETLFDTLTGSSYPHTGLGQPRWIVSCASMRHSGALANDLSPFVVMADADISADVGFTEFALPASSFNEPGRDRILHLQFPIKKPPAICWRGL